MAIIVQEKNTFLGLVSSEEELCSSFVGSVRRAQSVPPAFRPARAACESKQWSDIMSDSTEAPEDSCDSDDVSSDSGSTRCTSDGSPRSNEGASSSCCLSGLSSSDAGDSSPKRATALRLAAQRYDPSAAGVACVLNVLMAFLRSVPRADVKQEPSGSGTSMHFLVTVPEASMKHAQQIVDGAQQALLSAAYHSENVYVFGHARKPFSSLGMDRVGFQGRLCLVKERLCMDALDFGRCNRWCPQTQCHRRHPKAKDLTEIILEVQASSL